MTALVRFGIAEHCAKLEAYLHIGRVDLAEMELFKLSSWIAVHQGVGGVRS